MGGRKGVLVIDLAVGREPPVEFLAVPGGQGLKKADLALPRRLGAQGRGQGQKGQGQRQEDRPQRLSQAAASTMAL